MSNIRKYSQSGIRKRAYGFDESKFLPKQREAAAMLVEYEFADDQNRRRKSDIADELGISRATLYNWSGGDENFIAYKNYLAAQFFNSYLPRVYSKMLGEIEKGNMKGIELFLKRMGELEDRSELTISQGGADDLTPEERKKVLLERLQAEEAEAERTIDIEASEEPEEE